MRLTVEKTHPDWGWCSGRRECDICGKEEFMGRPRRWDLCGSCEKKKRYKDHPEYIIPKNIKKVTYIRFCQTCKRYFEVKLSNSPAKFCGSKCMGVSMRGKRAPNRKVDRSEMHIRLQNIGPTGQNEHGWRREIIKKRNFTCQLTGICGNVNCHHIDSVKEAPYKQFDEDNIIVVLSKIHKAFHINYMGSFKVATTKENWVEFCKLARLRSNSYE